MRDDLINGIARHLERIGNSSQALHLYKLAERPPSRERQVRILERTGRLLEALESCRRIAEDPWEVAELEFAERYIQQRLHRIQNDPHWPREVLQLYDRKVGIASDLVHWKFLPRDLVERSVRTIPREHLAAVFGKLSGHPGANKSGFPDLILFAPQSGRGLLPYEMVEVKGPADQLQVDQRHWLRYFSRHGIPYRIFRVQWRERK